MIFERSEHLKPTGKLDPQFRYRFTYATDQLPPIRAYFHNAGLGNAFGKLPSHQSETVDHKAKKYLVTILHTEAYRLIEHANFLLAALWGDGDDKMIDLFKFTDIQAWPGNPDAGAYVLRNGVYVPERREITCGDTLMVFGAEERHRRTTKTLKEYIENPPEIPGLITS